MGWTQPSLSKTASEWARKAKGHYNEERGRVHPIRPIAFTLELRKILCTTNAIESQNAQVRKAVRVRGHFPSEEAATKLIWLVLRNVQAQWKNPLITWQAASWRSNSRIDSY